MTATQLVAVRVSLPVAVRAAWADREQHPEKLQAVAEALWIEYGLSRAQLREFVQAELGTFVTVDEWDRLLGGAGA